MADDERNPLPTPPLSLRSRAQQQQQPQQPGTQSQKKNRKRAWSIFSELYSNGERRASFDSTTVAASHTPSASAPSRDARYPYKYQQLPSRESFTITMDHSENGNGEEHDDPAAGSTSNLVQQPDQRTGETGRNGIVPAQFPPPKGKYADVSFLDKLHLTTVMFRMPFVMLWFTLKNIVLHPSTIKRHTTISLIRWIIGTCHYKQIQYLSPPSVDTYIKWVKKQKPRMEVLLEPLVDDAVVMWVGKKRRDKVVLYIPGGAYLFPLSEPAISFWRYVQQELEAQGIDVGLAILAYSLIPEAGFPTQLRQAQLALEHVLASGVHPSDLQIVGDSAGGNLILSLLSHILHPLPEPHFRPFLPGLLPASASASASASSSASAPIKGVYLMSPWVSMDSNTASSRANLAYDIIVPSPGRTRANYVKAYITSQHQIPYLDFMSPSPSVPDSSSEGAWWGGLDGVVERLMMSAGGLEILRDDIIAFSQVMGKVKKREFTFVVQDGGVHVDPILEFMSGEVGRGGRKVGKGKGKDEVGELTPMIVSWLAAGYRSS